MRENKAPTSHLGGKTAHAVSLWGSSVRWGCEREGLTRGMGL